MPQSFKNWHLAPTMCFFLVAIFFLTVEGLACSSDSQCFYHFLLLIIIIIAYSNTVAITIFFYFDLIFKLFGAFGGQNVAIFEL